MEPTTVPKGSHNIDSILLYLSQEENSSYFKNSINNKDNNYMKKSLSNVPIIAVALVSLSFLTSYAFAESNGGAAENNMMQHEIKHESDKNKQEMNHEDGNNDDGEMDDQEEIDNENSLHDHLSHIPDIKGSVSISEVDATKINTYADVVTALNQYRDIILQIKSKGSITEVASSTLTAQEKIILSKLTAKHSFELSRTTVRANELLAQIKDLTDVLTPLGVQTISAELNFKNLLISQLNDFASTINSLTDLVDTTSTILDEETN